MDQTNNPTPPVTPVAEPVQPATPVVPAPTNEINLDPAKPIVHSSNGKKGGKMIWIIVLAIALVGIVGGGAYYLTQMNQAAPIATTTTPQATTSSEFASLEREVNGVNVETFDSEFTDVDQDLKGL